MHGLRCQESEKTKGTGEPEHSSCLQNTGNMTYYTFVLKPYYVSTTQYVPARVASRKEGQVFTTYLCCSVRTLADSQNAYRILSSVHSRPLK